MNETSYGIGQRVRILETAGDSGQSRFIGRTGSYVRTNGFGNYRHHLVSVAVPTPSGSDRHELVRATRIELASEPQGLGAQYAARYGTFSDPLTEALRNYRSVRDVPKVEEKPAEPEILLDTRRLQAASFAHQLLPNDASLDELIGMAEFAMGERTVDPEGTTGTVAVPTGQTVPMEAYERVAKLAGLAHEVGRMSPTAGAIDEEAELERAEKIVERRLTIRSIEVALDNTQDEDVVEIVTDGEAYLDARQVDELIEFLQAAKRVHAARF